MVPENFSTSQQVALHKYKYFVNRLSTPTGTVVNYQLGSCFSIDTAMQYVAIRIMQDTSFGDSSEILSRNSAGS